jgi:hypothetical protein
MGLCRYRCICDGLGDLSTTNELNLGRHQLLQRLRRFSREWWQSKLCVPKDDGNLKAVSVVATIDYFEMQQCSNVPAVIPRPVMK